MAATKKRKLKIRLRKARLADAKNIHAMINLAAREGAVIPRSLSEIYESIRDFQIAEADRRLVGCCALHIDWEDLAEIRSLVIDPEHQRIGLGSRLLKSALKEARELLVPRVFALTAHPAFFEKNGFERIRRGRLPHKIWGDCLKCPKFPKCDEVALWKKLS